MDDMKKFRPDPSLKLMDQVRQVLRYHHYAYKTEQTYCGWIVDFVRFFDKKIHPKDMGKTEIERYLSHLAMQRNVAASTQRQALNSIIFLYRHVLDLPVDEHLEPVRMGMFICPMRWGGSIKMPGRSSDGNTYFRQRT